MFFLSLKGWFSQFTKIPPTFTIPDRELWDQRSAKVVEECHEAIEELDGFRLCQYHDVGDQDFKEMQTVWLVKELCDAIICMYGLLLLLGLSPWRVLSIVLRNNRDRTNHSGMKGSQYAHPPEAKEAFKKKVNDKLHKHIFN